MKFSALYNYLPLHERFTISRVKQCASRLIQMKITGTHSSPQVRHEDAALFLYALAASQQTRFLFDTVMQEPELINSKGTRFVGDLSELLSDQPKLSKVKKVAIGSSVSIIEYKDRSKDLYTLGNNFDIGTFEQFDADFFKALANSVAQSEPVEQ